MSGMESMSDLFLKIVRAVEESLAIKTLEEEKKKSSQGKLQL